MPTLPATPAEIALAFLMAVLGATVQGSIGFGLAVVAAPVLVLVDPAWVPGPMLLAAALLVVLIAHRDRRDIVPSQVGLGIVGRIIGTLPAAYAISMLPREVYEILFAVLILLAVMISASGWHIRLTPVSLVVAATLSGIVGTLAAVGGPPLALIYQNEKGARMRGTMSAIFIVGAWISVAGLWWVGRFGMVELMLGLILMPGVVVGFALSRYTAAWLDRRTLRPVVLAVSALSALVVLLRAVW